MKHPVWLIFSVTCLFIGIVATLGYTNLVAADSSVGDPPPIPPEYEELLKEARTNGSVVVIVELNVNFQADTNLASTELQQQNDAIQLIRNQLVQDLSKYGVDVNSTSLNWSIPFVTLNVNENALQYLINSGYVAGIYENEFRRGN